MNNISRKLKELRQARRWKIADVADKLGFAAASSYQKIEAGTTPLTLDKLQQLAELFEVTMAELMGFEAGEGDRMKELEIKNRSLQQQSLLNRMEKDFLEIKSQLPIVSFYLSAYFHTGERRGDFTQDQLLVAITALRTRLEVLAGYIIAARGDTAKAREQYSFALISARQVKTPAEPRYRTTEEFCQALNGQQPLMLALTGEDSLGKEQILKKLEEGRELLKGFLGE